MCPESFSGMRFDLGSLLQGRMWYLIPMMRYISPIIGRRGFACEEWSNITRSNLTTPGFQPMITYKLVGFLQTFRTNNT